MGYKFFDKKYLVMPDDKDIIGKKVLYADHIDMLIFDVESGDASRTGILDAIITDCSFPFYINSARWGLTYYDPNYEAKVAYSQGKTIEYRRKGDWEDEWHVSTDGVIDVKCYDYRVKLDKWFVHEMTGGKFYKDNSNNVYVEFEGTKEECDKWIEEHTPKTRRMTNKELARWLAEGKGQKMEGSNKHRYCTYAYNSDDDLPCRDNVKIRAWDEEYWHAPLVEVKE